MDNCNLTTCRYNADGKCTNEEKREECVRVSKAVLIIDDLVDIEVPDNQWVKKHKDVAAMKTNTGTEHGIKWETEWNGENIRITVSTEDGRKTETRYYSCKYPVVCGYDVYDCNKVEEMLDEMIVKYANDGYKGSGKG